MSQIPNKEFILLTKLLKKYFFLYFTKRERMRVSKSRGRGGGRGRDGILKQTPTKNGAGWRAPSQDHEIMTSPKIKQLMLN